MTKSKTPKPKPQPTPSPAENCSYWEVEGRANQERRRDELAVREASNERNKIIDK